MVSLLKVGYINYECSCKVWSPLCQLHFCRKCDKLKCPMCLNEEIDIVFCPNCLENNSGNDSQQRKFCCNICNQCPVCENPLVTRTLGNLFYLQCNSCQWTSRESGIADQPSQSSWPEFTNSMEDKLNEVLRWMKDLDENERIERSRKIQATKRLSNLGVLSNDKFALNTAYNMRKKALWSNTKPKATEVILKPTSEVPELDPKIFTENIDPGKVPTLAQILRQPLCGNSNIFFPSKVKLISRRFLRCTESETLLYRGELNPSAVKAKMQCFAVEFVPEIRFGREINIVLNQPSSFFLMVSNYSPFNMGVVLTGEYDENDSDCIDCSEFSVKTSVANRDNAADIEDYLHKSSAIKFKENENEKIIVIQRHKIGLCINCKPIKQLTKKTYAIFKLCYNYPDETPNKWATLRVKVFMNINS